MKINQYYPENEDNLEVSFIDFPGFQEIKIQEYIKDIESIIKEKFEKKVNSKEKRNGTHKSNGSD